MIGTRSFFKRIWEFKFDLKFDLRSFFVIEKLMRWPCNIKIEEY